MTATRSASERALKYVRRAPRLTIGDLRDNPGARTRPRVVTTNANFAGHSLAEMRGAAKPPLGWIWGDFYKPWQRTYPGRTHFNADINLRREYPPISMIELQRLIDLGWLNPNNPIDLAALCNTKRYKCEPILRQFGVQLTDEGADVFAAKVNIEVQWASEIAIAAVERCGGRIITAYYDPISLTAIVDPIAWFRTGQPIPRRLTPPVDLIEYYTAGRSRGYLASAESIRQARIELAAKMGYEIDDDSSIETTNIVKHPHQVFAGIEPGWVVNLADRTLMKPTDSRVLAYYNRGVLST